jgi:hypothetical protein
VYDWTGTALDIRNKWVALLKKPPSVSPEVEIQQLKQKLQMLHEEDRSASRNALEILAENERLSGFRVLMERMERSGDYITPDNAEKLRKERDEARGRAERVGAALLAMEADWREFLAKGTFVGPLPKTMKAKPKNRKLQVKTAAKKPKPKPTGAK